MLDPVVLALRPLDGHTVVVRPRTQDVVAIKDTFDPPVHLPPDEIDSLPPLRIWDLGSNIGLTIAHLALLYEHAQIVGVEIDAGNAQICAQNISPWRDRCQVIEGAVWHVEGLVSYSYEPGNELGFRVHDDAGALQDPHEVEAMTLNQLARDLPEGDLVDYVKMDIEGAEKHVLRFNTEWAQRARSIKVEVHAPYTVESCEADLEAMGFETSGDPIFEALPHGMPPVVGVRRY